MPPRRIGFLTDPLEGLVPGHDSTLGLMAEALGRGHRVGCFTQEDLAVDARGPGAWVRPLTGWDADGRPQAGAASFQPLAELHAIFLRKDPPVDAAYLHATQMVELASPRPVLWNEPAGLREANEKLFAFRFPDLIPKTLVSPRIPELEAFVRGCEGGAVLKPLDGFAGRGIVHLGSNDVNTRAVAELLTERGRRPVVAQAYLPAAREGDKRIVLVKGEPVGALLRVASADDPRCNMATGGRAVASTLDGREREICRRVGAALRERGLSLVGIDVIGGFLTEINVTSPTGVMELERLTGQPVRSRVLDLVEQEIAARSTPRG
jgi:glutathione synthase